MPAPIRRPCCSSTCPCASAPRLARRVLRHGRVAQGRRRVDAFKQLPALLALGAGLAPHLTKRSSRDSARWRRVRAHAKKGIEVGNPCGAQPPLPRARRSADGRVGLCSSTREHSRVDRNRSLVCDAVRVCCSRSLRNGRLVVASEQMPAARPLPKRLRSLRRPTASETSRSALDAPFPE